MARRKGAPASGETHIIANMKFVKRSDELLGKLRYVQYRDDKHDHVPHRRGQPRPKRWVDRGMGRSYREIFNTCHARQSQHVLAWTWVISPDPKLMALVPQRERRALLERLTEEVVEAYYEARGESVPRYSYVLHDRDASTGQQQLHTHVILPGTVETLTGTKAFYNRLGKGHIALFNQVAGAELGQALDDLGIAWRSPTLPGLAPSSNLDGVLGEIATLGSGQLPATTSESGKPLGELDLWFGIQV
ncbi:MAG: hypothetical protein ACYDBJ_29055 [Aggregatilineales bacterium]